MDNEINELHVLLVSDKEGNPLMNVTESVLGIFSSDEKFREATKKQCKIDKEKNRQERYYGGFTIKINEIQNVDRMKKERLINECWWEVTNRIVTEKEFNKLMNIFLGEKQ